MDEICINQENLSERERQVQSMALISTIASRVIVWLGEAEDNSEGALEEIHRAANKQSMGSNPENHKAILS